MIGKLSGRFEGTTPDGAAIIDVGGVGYVVRVPVAHLLELKAAKGSSSLLVHTAVREDSIDLYGFPTSGELVFFKQLMSVSGIGPKTALNILNIADVTTLKSSIARGDSSALTKVFGIGKKSAERIVVELRDKISLEFSASGTPVIEGGDTDVIEALMALGYRAEESRKVLKDIGPAKNADARTRIAEALKRLGS
mgnify:CR=1 FL=1